MTVGYDPDRISVLTERTRQSIDALTGLRSDDPAAADALRAVRLLRRTLEDHWMPALDEIRRSEAMVSWTRHGPSVPWWLRTGWSSRRWIGDRPAGDATVPAFLRRTATAWANLGDDEIVDLLIRADRLLLTDLAEPTAGLGTFADEIARRAAADRGFAERIVRLSVRLPLVGLLTARARFPTGVVAGMVRSMMWPHGPAATVDLDLHAEALSTAIASLVGDAAACLDLLLDPIVLHGIASWERLDADVTTAFVTAGLHTAVTEDPGRLADGYAVLATLTALVNGPLDHGIQPGVALGVAASMAGYIETLAPAIRQEGSYPVVAIGPDLEAELGTYDDVVDLVGVLLREPSAQAALGTVVGAYTTSVVADLGAEIGVRPGLEYVTRFTDVIADASRTEQAELVMQAAAEAARRRALGNAIGFGTNAVLTASGVGPVTHTIVSQAISTASGFVARNEPASLPDARIPSTMYDLITVSVLRVVADDPTQRRQAGLGAVSRADWRELQRRLDEIDGTDDADERTRRILRLDRWLEREVSPLAAHLGRARSAPGMDELTEARTAVGTD